MVTAPECSLALPPRCTRNLMILRPETTTVAVDVGVRPSKFGGIDQLIEVFPGSGSRCYIIADQEETPEWFQNLGTQLNAPDQTVVDVRP